MKVEKQRPLDKPAYPSRREFSHYHLLVGLAVVGLGVVAGRAGNTPALGGEIAVEPRAHPPAAVRPPGGLRAPVGQNGATTNATKTATNAAPNACATTNEAPRLLGEPPAEPQKR